MKAPCELVVWYVLPAIKSDLAKELISRGMSQKEVASVMGVTEAAVSQYLKGKRGKKIELKENAKAAISEFADKIISGEKHNPYKEICRICEAAKSDKTLCGPHKEASIVPNDCDACFT